MAKPSDCVRRPVAALKSQMDYRDIQRGEVLPVEWLFYAVALVFCCSADVLPGQKLPDKALEMNSTPALARAAANIIVSADPSLAADEYGQVRTHSRW